ncbi:hypothetical protein BI364_13680 [Acidihalobacter yilgarnensis]|uniref:Uncharacterized protein n=1 Tax=Acidihalobacter yilgarnensis TaxID=2819280 RepID=A0A1D8IQQ1_9GAMM|nr:hypothetical protein BI364_13680 [Acidihalobacter yilgarnensis]
MADAAEFRRSEVEIFSIGLNGITETAFKDLEPIHARGRLDASPLFLHMLRLEEIGRALMLSLVKRLCPRCIVSIGFS